MVSFKYSNIFQSVSPFTTISVRHVQGMFFAWLDRLVRWPSPDPPESPGGRMRLKLQSETSLVQQLRPVFIPKLKAHITKRTEL